MKIDDRNIYSELLFFAIPILITNVIQKLYGMADTAIISSVYGSFGTSVIGISTSVTDFIDNILLGFANGFGVVLAKSYADNNLRKYKMYNFLSIIVGGGISILVGSLCYIKTDSFINILNVNASMRIDVKKYILISITFSLISFSFYNIISSIRATGNSILSGLILFFSLVINFFLDYLFVVVKDFGISSSALATGLSKLIFVIWYIAKLIHGWAPFKVENNYCIKTATVNLLKNGTAVACTFSIVTVSTLVMQGSVNLYSQDYIASYTLMRRISTFLLAPMMAITFSNSVYSAQKYGKGDLKAIKCGERATNYLIIACSIVIILFLLIFGKGLIDIVGGRNLKYNVVETTYFYLIVYASFYFFMGLLSNYRYMIQSSGYTSISVIISIAELLFKTFWCKLILPGRGILALVLVDPFAWILLGTYAFIKNKKILSISR